MSSPPRKQRRIHAPPPSSSASTRAFTINTSGFIRENRHRPPIHVSEPIELACYSQNSDSTRHYSSRTNLSTYHSPRIGANLGEGLSSFVRKSSESPLVSTVVHALSSADVSLLDGSIHVVTYRNNLNKIGGTMFSNRSDWQIECVCLENILFLNVIKTGDDPSKEDDRFKYMYYGYAFESLCTSIEKDKLENVDPNVEFCSVVRLKLGDLAVIMAAEIDCTLPNPPQPQPQPQPQNEAQADPPQVNPLLHYVELKTTKKPVKHREFRTLYLFKYPKFWLQSFLAGVRNVYLGYRSDDGTLLDVRKLQTHKLYREAGQFLQHQTWQPQPTLHFLYTVLSQMRRKCMERPGVTMRVCYHPELAQVQADWCDKEQVDMAGSIAKVITEMKKTQQ